MSTIHKGMKDERLNHYRSVEGSRHHSAKYKKQGKSMTHRKECGILNRLLGRVGRSREILDAPCGAGRFFHVTSNFTDTVCLGDISAEMLNVARENSDGRAASYTCIDLRDLPSGDESYEGVISLRLTHHIYDGAVLEQYFENLGQLSRRWLIVTFRDSRAPKTRWRRTWRKLGGRKDLPAQTLDEVAAMMRGHGLHLLDDAQVSRWFSGHRYALFVRQPETQSTES